MKKMVSLFLTLIMLLTMLPMSAFAAEPNVTRIVADSVYATAGESFNVDVKLENNPGIISANINIAFDEALTLIGAENGSAFPSTMSFIPPRQLSTIGEIKGNCNFAWQSADIDAADIADGVILSLQFKVADNAKIGDEYNITISARSSDIVDKDMNVIQIPKSTSSVTIKEYEPVPNPIDDFAYNLTDEGIVITGYTGKRTDVIIADSYEINGAEYSVVGIGESAFDGNEAIKSVIIPETVKTIEGWAFYDCTSLVDVTILSRDVVIGELALGYYFISRKEDGVTEGFTIYGYNGSTAQEYSLLEEGFTFVPLEEPECHHSGGIATCVSKAVCDTCHKEYGEINAENHVNIVIDEAEPATCTETGLTEGSHCLACETVIKAQKVIPMLDHVGGTATCSAKAVCDTCHKEYGEINAENHVNIVIDEAEPATCTETGLTEGSHCDDCGKVIVEQKVIKAAGHKWDNGTITTPANCVDEGVKTFRCTAENCNGTKTEFVAVDPNNHKTVVIDETVPATCTETGLTEGSHCSACKTVIKAQEVIPMLDHVGGTATCSAKAVCDICHKEYGEINAENHVNIVIDEAVPATCTETGLTEGSHCSACKMVIKAQEVIDMLPHKPVSADNGKDATCTENGKEADMVCSECGKLLEEGAVIPATNHAHTNTINDKQATCKEEGYTGDTFCNDCQTIIKNGEIIEKLEHTTKLAGKKEATCKETGYTGDVVCEVCEETISTGTVIEKLPHTPISADNAVAATCETEGRESDTICSVCKETLVTGKIIPALEHAWTEISRTEATCETDGVIEYVCDNDETHAKTEILKATGHVDEDDDGVCDNCGNNICKHENVSIVNAKPAACTEIGYTGDKVCDKCSTVVEKGEEIAKLDHTIAIDEAVSATCTDDGLTEGSHCSVCGTIVKAQEVIKAAGHIEVPIPGRAATCTEPGLTEGVKCSVCNKIIVEQSIIEMLAHEVVVDKAVIPTCTEDGLTEGSHCKNCNTVIVTQEKVPAKGHNFGEWMVVNEATCSSKGLESRKCSECEITETNEIPMTGFIDANGDGICDECGCSKDDHTANTSTSIYGAIKKIICMLLRLLESVFSNLDAAQLGNGPYKELLELVKALQKAFGCE